jgi:lipoprotein-releasing system permease protein
VTAERLDRLKTQVSEMAEAKMLLKQEQGESIRYPGVFVGQELAYEMGLIPGDFVTLISPTETEGPMSTVPRLKRFVVEGVYRSGMPEQEMQTVFAADQSVRGFLRRAGVVSQWEVTLKDFDSARSVADRIRPALEGGFRVQDWVQMNAHLFAALTLERIAMFVILAFIVVVASFNIITTLTLMVLEKKKEIAILKTMGAENAQVAAIFLSEGLLIGGGGVAGGVALGLLICLALKRWEFIQLPEVYIDRTLPVNFRLEYVAVIAVSALVIVVLACLYPSRRAARLTPLEGIRQ